MQDAHLVERWGNVANVEWQSSVAIEIKSCSRSPTFRHSECWSSNHGFARIRVPSNKVAWYGLVSFPYPAPVLILELLTDGPQGPSGDSTTISTRCGRIESIVPIIPWRFPCVPSTSVTVRYFWRYGNVQYSGGFERDRSHGTCTLQQLIPYMR